MDKYCETGKTAPALVKRMLCNDDFLALILSFVQTMTVDAIAESSRAETHESTSIANREIPNAAVAAEAHLVQGDSDFTRSKCSGEERSHCSNSHQKHTST